MDSSDVAEAVPSGFRDSHSFATDILPWPSQLYKLMNLQRNCV